MVLHYLAFFSSIARFGVSLVLWH